MLFRSEFASAKAPPETVAGHLSNWKEYRDPKTGNKQIAFFLASEDLTPYLEADAARDASKLSQLPKVFWSYGFLLIGEMRIYRADQIQAFEVDAHERATFSSGYIVIDRSAATVEVCLRVQYGSKTEEFAGNGMYPLPRSR